MKALIKIKNMLLGPIDNPQSGETLLSVLISLSIALVMIYQITTVAQHVIFNRMHIDLRKSRTDTKRMILQTMNCNTFNFACANNTEVQLRNFSGNVIVDIPYSTYGRWSVRAMCKNSTPEVQFAMLDPSSDPLNPDFLNDPKTKRPLSWSGRAGVPQDVLCRSQPNPLQIEVGTRCDRDTRWASNPTSLTGTTPSTMWLPGNICNPDGSDQPKPTCPVGTNEWYSYWDREDDWGKSGSWVVACR